MPEGNEAQIQNMLNQIAQINELMGVLLNQVKELQEVSFRLTGPNPDPIPPTYHGCFSMVYEPPTELKIGNVEEPLTRVRAWIGHFQSILQSALPQA